MDRSAKSTKPAGFTLLELIISITLLAVIVLIVAGAASLGYRSFSTGERRISAIERLRSSITIIDAQIQSGVPLTLEDGGVKEYYFVGEEDSLKLSTNYSIWGGQRGYVMVDYRVALDDSGKRTLYASEYKIGLDNQKEVKLLEGFDEISFNYFMEEATEEEGEWVTQWVDEERMPTKVRLNLVKGTQALAYVIPVRVGGQIGETE